MSWSMFDAGRTLGGPGPHAGHVLRDEEGPRGARLTLEEGASCGPYVITCTLPDTHFEHIYATDSSGTASRVFNAMKSDLDSLLAVQLSTVSRTDNSDTARDLIEQFVQTYR